MDKIKEMLIKLWFNIKKIPVKLRRLSRRTLIVAVYIAIILIMSGIVITRMTGIGGETDREAEFDKEKPDVIDVEDIFDSAGEDYQKEQNELEKFEQDIQETNDFELDSKEQYEIEEKKETESDNKDDVETGSEKESDSDSGEESDYDSEESEKELVEPVSVEQIPTGIWPVEGEIISSHGELYRVNNQYRYHNGIDIDSSERTKVRAAWSGEVELIKEETALGLKAKVASDGYSTTYANLGTTLVEEGDSVSAGDEIATVGTTANLDSSEGSYLHMSVVSGSDSLDPKQLLPDDSH